MPQKDLEVVDTLGTKDATVYVHGPIALAECWRFVVVSPFLYMISNHNQTLMILNSHTAAQFIQH